MSVSPAELRPSRFETKRLGDPVCRARISASTGLNIDETEHGPATSFWCSLVTPTSMLGVHDSLRCQGCGQHPSIARITCERAYKGM